MKVKYTVGDGPVVEYQRRLPSGHVKVEHHTRLPRKLKKLLKKWCAYVTL
jgi:hypothetical protein